MSRPRKMTLGDALEALKELPRVLKALEVLNGEQEKVMALMGKTAVGAGIAAWLPPSGHVSEAQQGYVAFHALPQAEKERLMAMGLRSSDIGTAAELRIRQRAEQTRGFEEPTEEQRARGNFGAGLPDDPRCGALASWGMPCRMAPFHGMEHCDRDGRTWRESLPPGVSPAARMEEARIILDTPERREYEEAKKAGKVVDDPFKNASEAQRERMAEQKALLALERARLRPAPPPTPVMTPAEVRAATGRPGFVVEDSIREESVDESANGSVGVEVET